MLVEAVFAVFAAGLIGAVSQRLRASRPVWATAAVVCLGLPALMVVAQLGVHRTAHTVHVGAGLLASFCFASVSSAFSWYATRHGALLGGTHSTSLVHDILSLPRHNCQLRHCHSSRPYSNIFASTERCGFGTSIFLSNAFRVTSQVCSLEAPFLIQRLPLLS
jgi:hypothetical protein